MIPDSVSINSGKLAINLVDGHGVHTFRGIPYAASPVGQLRWRAPQPCPAWDGIRQTRSFGRNAIQGIVFADIDPYAAGVSEDCLYLNVWTGGGFDPNAKRPVLFWIHGGGFVVGSGSEPRYDGSRLAARGIVVVTVNHRLNALGFLAHPALTKESQHVSSGNYGMLDLVAALGWVRDNIAQFGGDPDAVTIAGESAGSMAVSGLMASPLARGLFARAIGQSGSLLSNPTEPCMQLSEAEDKGLEFASKLGAANLEDLRSVAADAILDAAPGLGFRPIVDGHFLTDAPDKIFANGQHHDVPLLAGWNKDEGFNFNVAAWGNGTHGIEHWLRELFGASAQEASLHYPGMPPERAIQSAMELGGDLIIDHGTWVWIEAQRAKGRADIFRYRFERSPATPDGWFGPGRTGDPGAFHSCEIPYVFDTLSAMPWLTNAEDQGVADITASYWINFIKTGNPNGKGLAEWPSYRSVERPCLRIDTRCEVENDIDSSRHQFLQRAFS